MHTCFRKIQYNKVTQEKEKAHWILVNVVPRVGGTTHHNVLFGLEPPHVQPGMPLLLWQVGPTWGAEGSFPPTPSYNNAMHAVQQCKQQGEQKGKRGYRSYSIANRGLVGH